jgi:diacylglycerol kinase (ATP)
MQLIVLNARAGGGKALRLRAAMSEWLRRHHPGVPLQLSESPFEARRAVQAIPHGSRVVLVGGDGSVHHLLPALIQGGHEMALVPAGSGDDSARALGVKGLTWQRALSRALTGVAVPVDIGWASTEHEERPFFSSLGVGFDAAVAQRALHGPAWLRGQPRYLLATLKEVAALRLFQTRVWVDDQLLHQGPLLFSSTLNTATYGGGLPAVPHAQLDDGALNLLLAARFSRVGALAMLPRLMFGRHLGHAQVRTVAFEKMLIESDEPLPLAADGEPMKDAHNVVVRVGKKVLHVVPGHDGLRASSSRTKRSTSLSKVSTE